VLFAELVLGVLVMLLALLTLGRTRRAGRLVPDRPRRPVSR
jgi:hypothetical protein